MRRVRCVRCAPAGAALKDSELRQCEALRLLPGPCGPARRAAGWRPDHRARSQLRQALVAPGAGPIEAQGFLPFPCWHRPTCRRPARHLPNSGGRRQHRRVGAELVVQISGLCAVALLRRQNGARPALGFAREQRFAHVHKLDGVSSPHMRTCCTAGSPRRRANSVASASACASWPVINKGHAARCKGHAARSTPRPSVGRGWPTRPASAQPHQGASGNITGNLPAASPSRP